MALFWILPLHGLKHSSPWYDGDDDGDASHTGSPRVKRLLLPLWEQTPFMLSQPSFYKSEIAQLGSNWLALMSPTPCDSDAAVRSSLLFLLLLFPDSNRAPTTSTLRVPALSRLRDIIKITIVSTSTARLTSAGNIVAARCTQQLRSSAYIRRQVD